MTKKAIATAEKPKRVRNSAVQRRRGRKGGRPRNPITVPPASEAIPARPPGSPGRPTKCDPYSKQAAKFYKGFAAGQTVGMAAIAAGYEGGRTREWWTRGGKGEEPFRTFRAKAVEAFGNFQAGAAKKFLEKTPERWLDRTSRQDPYDDGRWRETKHHEVSMTHTMAPTEVVNRAVLEAAKRIESGDDAEEIVEAEFEEDCLR